jgi:hypothetical protein
MEDREPDWAQTDLHNSKIGEQEAYLPAMWF